jgi:cysteine desulfurase
MNNHPVYLDYNATTPVAPEVAEAMLPFITRHFGNPSSAHCFGQTARAAVIQARRQVAALLNCTPEEIIFTSGGTESNNHAIKGIAYRNRDMGRHIITTTIEHPAVTKVCCFLQAEGFAISYIPVDATGRVSPAAIAQAITPETILISVMHANNETGAIQPIAEIASIARRHNIVMHTDAAQSVGKIDTDITALNVDLLSIAGHKLYAPKGIGALYIRDGISPTPLMHGAGHESGRRAGTENVAQIVGLGQACELAIQHLHNDDQHLQVMRDRLLAGIRTNLGNHTGYRLITDIDHALPNTLNISFSAITAADFLTAVADRLALSAGSACHAGEVSISPVLKAMGIPEADATCALRFSVGRMTTTEEIDTAIECIAATVLQAASQQ